MGKNKNKALNFSQADKTILGLIANLNSSKRQYPNELETANAMTNIQELKNVLNGKARRVAECILNKNLQENDRVRRYANGLIEWADGIENSQEEN